MIISTVLIASTLFVPRTDNDTIYESPLHEGEIAHIVVGEKGVGSSKRYRSDISSESAVLRVGGKDGTTLDIIDQSALRGYRIETVARADYSIETMNGIIYNASNDCWSAASAPIGEYRLIATCPAWMTIDKVTYDEKIDLVHAQSPELVGSISLSVTGNVAIVTFKKNSSVTNRKFEISNFVIRRLSVGTKTNITDLRDHIFNLVDDVGSFTLGSLRSWAIHLYDGNRGENWSEYKATSTTHLEGQTLTFDDRNRYSFMCNPAETNLILKASGEPIMSIYSSGDGTGYEDSFTIKKFSHTSTNVVFSFSHDIDGFNPQSMSVQYSTNMTNETWFDMPQSSYVIKTSNEIECSGNFSGIMFFRLNYEGNISHTIAVKFLKRVTFTDGIDVTGQVVLSGKTLTANKSGIIAVESDVTSVETNLTHVSERVSALELSVGTADALLSIALGED